MEDGTPIHGAEAAYADREARDLPVAASSAVQTSSSMVVVLPHTGMATCSI